MLRYKDKNLPNKIIINFKRQQQEHNFSKKNCFIVPNSILMAIRIFSKHCLIQHFLSYSKNFCELFFCPPFSKIIMKILGKTVLYLSISLFSMFSVRAKEISVWARGQIWLHWIYEITQRFLWLDILLKLLGKGKKFKSTK